jgi:hypothetical protein
LLTGTELISKGSSTQEQERERKISAFEKSSSPSPDKPVPVGKEGEEFYLLEKGRVHDHFFLFWEKFRYPKGKAEAADIFLSVYSEPVFIVMIKGAEIEARNRSFLVFLTI